MTQLVAYDPRPTGPEPDAPLAAYLILDDPQRRNALSDTLLDQFTEGLDRAAADPGVRVIVLTSSHDKVFSSGGNLDAFADMITERTMDHLKFSMLGNTGMRIP